MDENLSSALRKTNIVSRKKGVIRPLPSVDKHSIYKEHCSGVHVTAWTTQCQPHFSCVETASRAMDCVSIMNSLIFYSVADTRVVFSSRGSENNTAVHNRKNTSATRNNLTFYQLLCQFSSKWIDHLSTLPFADLSPWRVLLLIYHYSSSSHF